MRFAWRARFALLPFVGFMLAGSPIGFRWIALPGGLALFVVPAIVHFVIPQSANAPGPAPGLRLLTGLTKRAEQSAEI